MRKRTFGFSIVELVMIVLLIAVLAAIVIPNFIDFRKEAKNSAVQAGIGFLRSSIAAATTQIELKEDPTTHPKRFPSVKELQEGIFGDEHPALKGKSIFEAGAQVPKNPWTSPTLPPETMVLIVECEFEKGQLNTAPGLERRGWCYRSSTGEIWANTNINGAGDGKTENYY